MELKYSSMAIKESSQRHVVEQQFVHIADLQKVNNRLRETLHVSPSVVFL